MTTRAVVGIFSGIFFVAHEFSSGIHYVLGFSHSANFSVRPVCWLFSDNLL